MTKEKKRASAEKALPHGVLYGIMIGLLSVLIVTLFVCIIMMMQSTRQATSQKTVAVVESSRQTLDPASSYQDEIDVHTKESETTQSDLVIFPDSSTVLLTDAQVQALSDDEIQYAIDEIYARHGFIFSRKSAYERLKDEPWYHPTEPDMQKVADSFNSIERKNVDLLATYRAQRRALKESVSG